MSDVLTQLISKCSLSRPTDSTEATGYTTKVYSVINTAVPCAMRQPSGSESIRYGREAVRNTAVFVLYHSVTPTPRDRIIFNGRTFDIQSCNPVTDDISGVLAWTECICEETV